MIKTAILIFSRSAKEESRHKKLHPNKKVNGRLHLALHNKTIKTVQKTGLPYLLIDEHLQAGNGFGEKIANAINSVFQKNYDNVITIGNDCPQLSSQVLLDAANKMNQNQLVVGPDRNGGIYLFGISANLFDSKTFSQIPWQTGRVYDALLEYRHCISYDLCLLEKLSDFNKLSDFYFLKNIFHRINSFISLITLIITGKKKISTSILTFLYWFHFANIKQLRAPPAFC